MQEGRQAVKGILKNNIRLPGTGRAAPIMFKATMAGDACEVSTLLVAQGPEVGEMMSLVKSSDL